MNKIRQQFFVKYPVSTTSLLYTLKIVLFSFLKYQIPKIIQKDLDKNLNLKINVKDIESITRKCNFRNML